MDDDTPIGIRMVLADPMDSPEDRLPTADRLTTYDDLLREPDGLARVNELRHVRGRPPLAEEPA